MPRQIVILGMHRSGTSMVAGVLQRLGVSMGEYMLGSDVSNPAGHYEDIEFLRINKAILAHAGGNWRNPPSHEAIMSVHKFDAQMAALVAKRDAAHELWGWKDPRTCLTLCKWAPLLSEPVYVSVERDLDSVARSLMRRNRMTNEEALALDKVYWDRADDTLAAVEGRKLWVCYDDALLVPERCVEDLARGLGVDPTADAVAFIDPALDHSKVPTCV